MYLPIFLPWAKQHTAHTPPPHLLPASSPPSSARSVRVWNVKGRTLSFKLSQPPVSPFLSSSPHALCFFKRLFLMFVSYTLSLSPSFPLSLSYSSLPPSLPLFQVGWLLQVAGARDPSANEKWVPSCAVTLMNLAVRRPITLLHLASPRKPTLYHTHAVHAHTQKWQALWTKYLSCWRKRLRSGKYAVKRPFCLCAHVFVYSHNNPDVVCFWDYFQRHPLQWYDFEGSAVKSWLKVSKVIWNNM